jgi:formate hydrogenlyase transcriptional activator
LEKNEFFQEATLKICGSLEIEEALQQLLLLLKNMMPISEVFLQFFDSNYQALRTIARATESECKKLDLLSPLTKEVGSMVDNVPIDKDAILINDPQGFPVTREMGALYQQKATSVMILFLKSKGESLGFLVLKSEDAMPFSEDHLKWVSMLKDPLVIAMSNALKHREVIKLNDLLADDYHFLQSELRRFSGDEIIGIDFGLKGVIKQVQQVASLDSPVILLGETGVGKDVIANTIHHLSHRSNGPFITVNCGAIPDNLIDSELFGHEKGSFTGALSQKRGRFERANKGTIFLDEIGELPPAAQVRLLRVLQNKEIERVGGVNTISLDIRIIAATNRNLEEMVVLKEFREDLWFRLNVFPIQIPALRERKCDIPALVQYFINAKAKELKLLTIPEVLPGNIEKMMDYHWPGNVRELQNVIERSLIINPAGPIKFEHLNTKSRVKPLTASEPGLDTYDLEEVISRHIKMILGLTKGKINGNGGAAVLLGLNPSTLRNKMIKLGIDIGKQKTEASFNGQ